MPTRITAVITSHNRRPLTVAALEAFFACASNRVQLRAVLCDDGSSDGTFAAVHELFPSVVVVEGSGDLFWARGMAAAERVALAPADAEHLLWLNDDVRLDRGGVDVLLDVAARHGDVVVCGATRDPDTGVTTYSGVRRTGPHPLRFTRVEPGTAEIPVETCNGNVVLVPVGVARRLGGIDAAFRHAYADFDFGLRARAAGIPVLLAPGSVGTCAANAAAPAWRDRSLPARARWRHLIGPRGLPPRSHARYLRRHGGAAWPLVWAVPYVRTARDVVLEDVRGAWRVP